jgi:hypothetical protein
MVPKVSEDLDRVAISAVNISTVYSLAGRYSIYYSLISTAVAYAAAKVSICVFSHHISQMAAPAIRIRNYCFVMRCAMISYSMAIITVNWRAGLSFI